MENMTTLLITMCIVLFFIILQKTNNCSTNSNSAYTPPNLTSSVQQKQEIENSSLFEVTPSDQQKQEIENSSLFEVTPSKKCEGGPYTYSSNDEIQKICSDISQDEINKVSCQPGYNGRPIHFEFTPLSDDKWTNKRCYL